MLILFSKPNIQTPSPPEPLTYLKTKHKELYLNEMAFIKKKKTKFEWLIQQDKAAMAGQMPDNLFGILEALAGGQLGQGQAKEGEGKDGGRVGIGVGSEDDEGII